MRQSLPLVAIIGRPNVGKSALFNRLIGAPRAIVATEAGTTRDPVQAPIVWNGRSFWLVDTAGLQSVKTLGTDNTQRQLAAGAQSQVEEAKAGADIIVMVVDGSLNPVQEDIRIAKSALRSRRPVILAVNKSDKAEHSPPAWQKLGIKHIIATSAAHSRGIEELAEAIASRLVETKPAKVADQRLAIVGRPNVGKSALFNRLTGSKAIVSATPGTTRDLNIASTSLGSTKIEISDTGGIRRPGARRGIEQFSYLRTLHAIGEADVVAVVLDATEAGVALDQKIAGLVADAGRGLILVINKWDLVEDKETRRLQLEQQLARDFAFVWWAPLIFVSAAKGTRTAKILEIAQTVIEHHRIQLPTSQLNQVLGRAVANHPPAGLKNRQPKLKYLTQTGSQPPTFSFFGSHLDWLHWSYKRYLEAQLRQGFDLSGTPIRLVFRPKDRYQHETRRRTRKSR